MRGMRYVPWFIAAVFWGLTIGTGISGTAADLHGTIDCGTIISSCWLIRRYGPRRLQPGERIVSDADAERMEDAAFRAALIAVQADRGQPGATLRIVSGMDT